MDKQDEHAAPLLTEVVCPGEELMKQGLWLPRHRLSATGETAGADTDWQQRLPPKLRSRGDLILQAVLKQLHKD